MPASIGSDVVVLAVGVAVPLPALKLAWDLENRGCVVRLDEDGALLAGPREKLTTNDRRAIREYRDGLITIVRYCDERERVI